jgi:MFS family permease
VNAPPPPRSRVPFRISAFALAVTAFGAGLPTPLYVVYEEQFRFGSGTLTLIFGAYTVGVLATMLLVAPLSDEIGRKPVLLTGLALTAASGVLWATASGVATLAIARLVSGLGVGATTSTATASMASLEPRADQHHVARISVAANFGGVASGILLTGIWAQWGPDPRVLVYLVLLGAGVLGIGLVLGIPETVPKSLRPSRLRVQRLAVPGADRTPFWVSASALAACYSIYGLFAALAPSFLREELEIRNFVELALIVAALFGTAAAVQSVLGQIRDRRALLLGLPVLLGGLVGLVVALLARSWPLLAVDAVVLGAGVGLAYMGSVTLVDRVAESELRGEILSAYYLSGYLALAVPTLGVGLLAATVGLAPAAEAFGVTLAGFVLVVLIALRRTPTPAGGEGWPASASHGDRAR